jgi:AAA family ATP:ADP antiporter
MLWPIYGEENWKFLSMVFLQAAALFTYTSVRITKDALIITAQHSDAAVLNFLKAWVVMPCAILFPIYINIMSRYLSKKHMFYASLLPFAVFFVLFAIVLYPAHNYIHMSPEHLASWQAWWPNLRYLFPIFGYWSFSLFYVMAEMVGNTMITYCFWGFANNICNKTEVAKYYPLFGAYGNIGLITAGFIQRCGVSTESTLILAMSGMVSACLLYWYISNNFVTHEQAYDLDSKIFDKKAAPGVWKTLKMACASEYLVYILLIVFAYGMSVNLAETTWKAKVKQLYPGSAAYRMFMGDFFLWTGIITMLIGLFVKGIITRFGWMVAALATPIVLCSTTCLFFGFTMFFHMLPGILLVSSPVQLAVIIGAIQNISGKSTKYALFDPTLQMTWKPLQLLTRSKEKAGKTSKIELEEIEKAKIELQAKAGIDVTGSRISKSLGGHIQSGICIITGLSQLEIAPYLALIAIAISVVWIFSVVRLSKLYHARMQRAEETTNEK